MGDDLSAQIWFWFFAVLTTIGWLYMLTRQRRRTSVYEKKEFIGPDRFVLKKCSKTISRKQLRINKLLFGAAVVVGFVVILFGLFEEPGITLIVGGVGGFFLGLGPFLAPTQMERDLQTGEIYFDVVTERECGLIGLLLSHMALGAGAPTFAYGMYLLLSRASEVLEVLSM